MSLINQMLQDLDARRAAHGVGANLPKDVRPLPVLKSSRVPAVLGDGVQKCPTQAQRLRSVVGQWRVVLAQKHCPDAHPDVRQCAPFSSLPDETRVYPGHGPATSIGFEKQFNPFLS